MIYDIHKTWFENLYNAPCHNKYNEAENTHANTHVDDDIKGDDDLNFLGYKVSTNVGIAAGPLLNSEWIKYASLFTDFGILTYKTIRTHEHNGHPLPNIVYLDDETLSISNTPTTTITNSFGMPSMSQEYLVNDIKKAIQFCNEKNKVLVVSITGASLAEFIENAKFVKQLDVPVVEANFSCPNVVDKSNIDLYLNTHVIFNYVFEIKKTLGDTPLIIKVGHYSNPFVHEYVLQQISKGGAQAVSGINSIKFNISGFPRTVSGVCGKYIKEYALHFIKDSRKIIDTNKLNLQLIGVGGIMSKRDVTEFVQAGADWVQCATGFMLNPRFLSF
jgi:dihydroorotate dehydrogenase